MLQTITELNKVQMFACLRITGAMRTTMESSQKNGTETI